MRKENSIEKFEKKARKSNSEKFLKTLYRIIAYAGKIILIFRVLSTPTESTWKGVSQLPDYKASFPKWRGNSLAEKLNKYLSPEGIDLLQVCTFLLSIV